MAHRGFGAFARIRANPAPPLTQRDEQFRADIVRLPAHDRLHGASTARESVGVRLGQVEATTEELRTATIKFRAIFDDLLQAPKLIGTKAAA